MECHMNRLMGILLLLALTSTAWAGPCFDLSKELRTCRRNHGTIATTTTTSTTSTTVTVPTVQLLPYHGFVSQNCQPQPACVSVVGGGYDGMVLCFPLQVMADCSFPPLAPPPPR